MAEANISVNKQTVLQLLKSGQEVPFLIPEYQRPYSWSDEEIITLFDDIWGFSIDRTQPNGAKSYFLGCVVSYKEHKSRVKLASTLPWRENVERNSTSTSIEWHYLNLS